MASTASDQPERSKAVERAYWEYVQRYHLWLKSEQRRRGADDRPYLDDGGAPVDPDAFLATCPPDVSAQLAPRIRDLWKRRGSASGFQGVWRDWLVPLNAFELGNELGSGGMGLVVRARDRVLGRTVAIKFIHPGSNPEGARERLWTEARLQSELQHPGLVPVHQFGVDPERGPFMVMEPIPGATLAAVLDHEEGLVWSTQDLLDVFLKVCQAVGYAHQKELSHGDLKPQNVKVGVGANCQPDGRVWVLDWGLGQGQIGVPGGTRDDGSSVPTGPTALTVAGTPSYMAPEQAAGTRAADPRRTDVFLLGGILCQILTGGPPYAGSAERVRRAARAADLEPTRQRLEKRRVEYPALVELALECLCPRPDGRPVDANAVAARVRAYQTNVAETQVAQLVTRAAAEEKRKRRGLVKWVRMALVALALVVAWVGWGTLSRRVSNERNATGSLEQCELALRDDDAVRAAEHLGQAEQRRSDGGCERLAPRFARCQKDLRALQELDRIGDARWNEVGAGRLNPDQVYADLPAVFECYGVVPGGERTGDESLNESLIRDRLLQELDSWLARDPRPELVPILSAVDPDPLRDETRSALARRAWAAAGTLADRAIVTGQPPRFLAALGEVRALGTDLKERALRAAVHGRPRSFSMHMALGGTYPADTPRAAEARVGCYQAALSGRPGSAVALTYLGVALHDKQDLEGGLRCHRAALEIDPGCVSAHNNLAVLLLAKGDFEGAARAARAAIRLDPQRRYPAPRHNLGLALSALNDKAGAVGLINEAIEINGNVASTYYNLGNILGGLGQVEKAIEHYQRAIALDPKFTPAYHHWAMTLHDQRKWKEAVAVYERAIKADPQERFLWNGLGNALVELGDLKGAAGAYKAAVVLSPDYPTGHANLARVLVKRSEWREAVKHFKELVRLEPDREDYKKGLKTAEFAAGLLAEPKP